MEHAGDCKQMLVAELLYNVSVSSVSHIVSSWTNPICTVTVKSNLPHQCLAIKSISRQFSVQFIKLCNLINMW